MKRLICFMPCLVLSFIGVAQYSGQVASNLSTGGSQDGAISAQINTLLGPSSLRSDKLKKDYAEFQGSPYLSNLFLPTTMFYKEENLGKIYYRYNALNEEVEIKKTNLEEEAIKSLGRDKEISILVDGKKMSFKTFVTSKKRTMNGYLISLLEGKVYDLYKRTHVKFTEGKPAANSFTKAVPARFSKFTEYYFQKKDVARMDEIPLKNGRFLKLLDTGAKERLKVYLKDNDLNLKNEADLISAFQFLNNL